MLDRAGEIELPAVRQRPLNPFVRRQRPQPVLIDAAPLTGPLRQIQPIEIQQVRRTAEEPLFNSLIEHHHYLGYEQPVGEGMQCTLRRPSSIRVVFAARVIARRTGSYSA